MYPVLPDLDVPLLNKTLPDTPIDAAFPVLIVSEPEPALGLLPLWMVTAPPNANPVEMPPNMFIAPPANAPDVEPALIKMSPPAPLRPWPTMMLMLPPLPPVAIPLDSTIHPLFPDTVVPELSTT